MRFSDLPQLAGQSFGPTEWSSVSQKEVDDFADLTHDHNPIHVDPAAAAQTPFGGTIVHGYFTVSLLAPVIMAFLPTEDASMAVNYGFDRLRFPAPLPVGERYRTSGEVLSVDEVAGGYQILLRLTVEVQGNKKPALVADALARYYA